MNAGGLWAWRGMVVGHSSVDVINRFTARAMSGDRDDSAMSRLIGVSVLIKQLNDAAISPPAATHP